MRLSEVAQRAARLVRGSGRGPRRRRLGRAADLLVRLGPRGFVRVLREAILGPPRLVRGGPHPPADGPPPRDPKAGPLVSVLLVHAKGEAVGDALASLSAQGYARWEVCREEASDDQDWASALGRALDQARGEWVLRLFPADRLGVNALAWIAYAAREDPRRDVVYFDEDRLDGAARVDPRFKPDWSSDTLLSSHYTGRGVAFKASLLRSVGGYRREHLRALDYDLILRASERADEIHHIPRILYHARGRFPAPDLAGRRALEQALGRRGEEATVAVQAHGYRVRRRLSSRPRVAILVPTRDRRDLLERCLDSHWRLTGYATCEVVVIDDGSREPTQAWLRGLNAAGRIRLVRREAPFNYSALMNAGARATSAEVLVCLNDDTEVLAPGWIEFMLEHIQRPDVGAVGARLLLADGRVQHAGVVLGVGPDRVAAQAHLGEPEGSAGYCGGISLVHDCSAVTAACLMIRREQFERVGGFDEEALKVSYSDVDLCLKLAARGLRTVYCPDACLRHLGSASRSRATDPREVQVMRERWGRVLARDPFYSPHLNHERADFTWAG